MDAPRTLHRRAREQRRAKLRWRCRRGMKELDLLLERLLEQGLEDLSDHRMLRLEELLDHPDQDLLAWLSGAADPGNEELAALARWIRGRIGVTRAALLLRRDEVAGSAGASG